MMSSISILMCIFAVFIFAEAGLSTKIAKICTQQKFPTIRYHVVYNQLTEGSLVERKMVMAVERLTSWFLSVISKGSKIG